MSQNRCDDSASNLYKYVHLRTSHAGSAATANHGGLACRRTAQAPMTTTVGLLGSARPPESARQTITEGSPSLQAGQCRLRVPGMARRSYVSSCCRCGLLIRWTHHHKPSRNNGVVLGAVTDLSVPGPEHASGSGIRARPAVCRKDSPRTASSLHCHRFARSENDRCTASKKTRRVRRSYPPHESYQLRAKLRPRCAGSSSSAATPRSAS